MVSFRGQTLLREPEVTSPDPSVRIERSKKFQRRLEPSYREGTVEVLSRSWISWFGFVRV
jgi:hypothetical protein